MQKRKFDELISHFNRKVSDMSIDQKYKMELLGMISAIGFAHEEELGTNLARTVKGFPIDADLLMLKAEEEYGFRTRDRLYELIRTMPKYELPSAQPEIIRCRNCKFASGDSRVCMKFGHSPIGELDFCAWAERRTDE